MTWRERDHPRNGDGQFAENNGWIAQVAEALPGGAYDDGQVYYHGTVVEDLEHVQPANTHRRGVAFPNDTDPDYAYASPSERNAWHYAELAWNNSSSGIPRVYRVRSTGPVEEDPYYPGGVSRGNFSDDIRSRHPFEILDELPTPDHFLTDPDDDWDDL